MKIQVEKYKELKSVLYGFIVCSLIMAIFCLLIAFYERDINRPIYHTSIKGSVEKIEIDEEDNFLHIKLVEHNNIFTVNMRNKKVRNFAETVKINDYLELIVSEKRIDKTKIPIIKVIYEEKEILDLEEALLKTANGFGIASAVGCYLTLFLVIIVILLKRNERLKLVDYYEYFLPISSKDFINKNNYSYEQLEKRNKVIIFSYLGFNVLLMILIAIFASIYPDYPHIIIPITTILCLISIFLLFRFTKYYKSTKEDVKLFVEMYMEYLNKEKEYSGEIQMFTDLGFKTFRYYLDEDVEELDAIISYEELDLYAVCVYKNNFHHAHIFICSDYIYNDFPIWVPLDNFMYKEIKKYNIKVKNLDYLLNNLEEEINKNKPKFGAKVVKYKD